MPPNPRAPLLGRPSTRCALTWAQGAGGIVSSLQDMTTWDRALYQGQELPPPSSASSKALSPPPPAIRSPGRRPPIRPATGSASRQATSPSIGAVWFYEGVTLGYRVLHLYFPRSGIIIALAANSDPAPGNDDLGTLALSVYQALQKAGAGQGG